MVCCIYCRNEKDDSEFTLEHVIPQSLGGAYAPAFLKTRDVCKSCNNNLGLFVDASFEKNWMVSNWMHDASLAFYDKEHPVGVSLRCMGNSDLCPPGLPEGHVCEMWLGPLGEQVFWLRPHDEKMPAYVGGNPRTVKSIETRAYFLFSENTQQDLLKTWLSFEQAFQGRRVRKIMCSEVEGADPASIGFVEPDDLDLARKEFFLANSEGRVERQMQITVNPMFDQRFMCKLAIGVAYCLFGFKALDSDYGKELHKGLWSRGGDDEAKVRGSALFAKPSDPNFNKLIGFPSAITVVLLSTPDGVAVNLNISSQLNWTILCAPSEILTTEDVAKIGDGQVLLLVRALQIGVHLELPCYLAYKIGITSHAELNLILERLERNKV